MIDFPGSTMLPYGVETCLVSRKVYCSEVRNLVNKKHIICFVLFINLLAADFFFSNFSTPCI
jgi:hypothetical protein